VLEKELRKDTKRKEISGGSVKSEREPPTRHSLKSYFEQFYIMTFPEENLEYPRICGSINLMKDRVIIIIKFKLQLSMI
jgi:hypothetical protein